MSIPLVPTKQIDYLDEDKKIRGQNYVLLSFLSPEDIIVNKEAYYFTRFINQFSKDITTLLEGIQSKYPDSKDLIQTVKTNNGYMFDSNEMNEQYKFFKSVNSSEIEAEYYKDNNFQTSIRGIKVRGVFDSIDEAKNRSEFIKKIDDKFDIFIGEVGCWCPWSPNPNDLENQEYAETQLNTLMKKYKENMESKDIMFEKRKQESINSSKTTTEISEISDSLQKIDPWSEQKLSQSSDTNDIIN